jgi:predicted enzyme related to lactoylglutathione lyase
MNNYNSAAVLFTINMQSIARFYERIFGMRLHGADQDHIVLEIDGFRLTVHKIPDVYAEGIRISIPPKIREDSAIKLSLPVANIASTRQTASQLGGCVYEADREWEKEGTLFCDGWDPDGNVFQLFERGDR